MPMQIVLGMLWLPQRPRRPEWMIECPKVLTQDLYIPCAAPCILTDLRGSCSEDGPRMSRPTAHGPRAGPWTGLRACPCMHGQHSEQEPLKSVRIHGAPIRRHPVPTWFPLVVRRYHDPPRLSERSSVLEFSSILLRYK